MKVYYDDEVDALYINLGDDSPEGVNIDTTAEDKIVGIEILNASRKIDLNTILSYTIELDKDLITKKTS